MNINKLLLSIVLLIVICLTLASSVSVGLLTGAIEALFYTHFNIITLAFLFMLIVFFIRR